MKKQELLVFVVIGMFFIGFLVMFAIGTNPARQENTNADLVYTCYEKDNMIIMEVSNYTRGENGNKRQTERESSIKD